MIRKYFVPALMAAALLTGCQAPQGNLPGAGGGDEILRLH